jgi:hypothetical protein
MDKCTIVVGGVEGGCKEGVEVASDWDWGRGQWEGGGV